MNAAPTTEDRIWAVLSHLSALSFGMGILLPVIGWSDQRRKSNYASFQCLQALGYQSVGFTIWVLSYMVMILLVSVILLVMLRQEGNSEASTAALSPGMVTLLIVIFGGFVLYFVLPILAAIACALGMDFHYPVLGARLSRYLRYELSQKPDEQAWLEEDHEFRWVAAMGHFSILIALWGMLAPLMAWILQGRNSSFLRFQSIQTLVFQALTTVLYVVGVVLYVFGIFVLFVTVGAMGGLDFNSPIGMVSAVLLIVVLLFAAALILFVPLLHILGQWAGYRVLKGENYQYPIIGKLVEKQMSKYSLIEENPT
ncbi:MAG TPA: DUF4870 domain-containing protein [Anaerolineales bacterium]|nr:DUF4870 domain-containing protein [Anaerolineales bacterium]